MQSLQLQFFIRLRQMTQSHEKGVFLIYA